MAGELPVSSRAFRCCLFVLVLTLASSSGDPARDYVRKPNIVLILADDLGWGSAGCYGAQKVKTPNIDRLATEGRKFTQAYAPGSVCSPTRYGLLTGRYCWRTNVKDGQVLAENAPLLIETNRLTLASLCKNQGYETAAFGKWHLGLGLAKETDWNQPLTPGPRALGFDYFFGLAANPWNGPHTFIENDQLVGRVAGERVAIIGQGPEATTTGIGKPYAPDRIMETLTSKATDWLKTDREKPFFLYFAPNAVHQPIAPNAKFTGSPYGKYGDFINELDWSVGQILGTLDDLKLAENTLVIFTSDNGGVVNSKNPFFAAALDAGLAINGPLRGGKQDIWEGGFREPFLVRWPRKVPAGTVSDQMICLTDLVATFAHIFEAPLPNHSAEDSFDVIRSFTETTPGPPVRDQVILQAGDATYAIRSAAWKLIERADAPKIDFQNKRRERQVEMRKKAAPQQDELFNLKDDPEETRNVFAENEEIATKLKKILRAARDSGSTRPNSSQ